jgi:SHS2 domain-containing protein
MAYGWGEHVGELVLWVQAGTEEGVFTEALRGMAELLADEAPGGPAPSEWREVDVRGDDRARLFAAWLEELAFLAETEGFVPDAVAELALEPGTLRARVGGHRGAPPHLVKAVTLHDLRFEPAADGWRARALLDV